MGSLVVVKKLESSVLYLAVELSRVARGGCTLMYCMAGNFGREFILADWRF